MTSLRISSPRSPVSGFLHEIGRVVASMAAGARAAREYRDLNSRTHAALAREGIARSDIPRVVLQRSFP